MDLMIFSRKNVSFCANCRGVIMAELSKWVIPESMQDEYISNLTKMLSGLRDLMGINQSDIAKMIGVSRQTYSAIETGRRKMSWATYLSLVLLFVCDKATSTLFQNSEAFPVRIIEQINSDFSNNGFSFFSRIGNAKDITKMMNALDEQGIHAMETVLLLEYARCTKQSGDAIIRSFDGSKFHNGRTVESRSAQMALNDIKRQNHE